MTNASVVSANSFNGQLNDTLSAGGDMYLYAVSDGGATSIFPSANQNFITDNSVNNSASITAVVIGHSLHDSANFSTGASDYSVAEAKIVGGIYNSLTYYNGTSGASGLSGNFWVSTDNTLAVILVGGGGLYSITLSSTANFKTLTSNGTQYSTVLIAYQYLAKGEYSFKATFAGQGTSGYWAAGAEIYLFSPVIVSGTQYMTYFEGISHPAGMDWNVTFNGITKESNSSYVWFQNGNGTYPWMIENPVFVIKSDERVLVNLSYGIDMVTGEDSILLLQFRVQYWLNVSANDTNGSVKPQSGWFNQSSSIWISAFSDPGYVFTGWIGHGDGNYTGSSSEIPVTINGHINETAHFTVARYYVAFTESGLPAGTSWWCNLSGTNLSSTSTVIKFSLPNGTYNYKTGSSGFIPSVSGGLVSVDGNVIANGITNVTFTGFSKSTSVRFYNVTFDETGLIPGTPWLVLFNTTNTGQSSSVSSISFAVINGTYKYQIYAAGYTSNVTSGVINLFSTSHVIYVKFTRTVFIIHDQEKGFPGLQNGSAWEISLDSTNYFSTTSWINVTLTNGTHSISYFAPPDYYIFPFISGTVRSYGTDISRTVDYVNSYTVQGSLPAYEPIAAVSDPDNGYLYVANYSSNSNGEYYVTVFQGSAIIAEIPIGYSDPYAITWNPVNGLIYVANDYTDDVTVINGTSIIAEIQVGYEPTDITSNPANGFVYVANYDSSTVSVISGLSVIETINVMEYPYALIVSPANGYLYVTSENGYVSVLNNSSTVSILRVGSDPDAITYNAENGLIYVANSGSNNVSVVNGTIVVSSLNTGSEPYGILYDPSNGLVYVTNYNSNNLSVINGLNQVLSLQTGSEPWGLTYNPVQPEIYVCNYGSGNISTYTTPGEYFTVSGLTHGSLWGVSVSGGVQSTSFSEFSENPLISFSLIPGSYSYSIYSNGFRKSISSGTLDVSDQSETINVELTRITYNVYVNETGLPDGTTWYVNLSNGQSFSSSVSSLNFSEPNGTYAYHIASSDKNYVPEVYGSTFSVTGNSIQLPPITFLANTYRISFSESGLPTSVKWSVSSSDFNSGLTSNASVSLYLTNGTYSYAIASGNSDYAPSEPTDTFMVIGHGVNITVRFISVKFNVTFTETGLVQGTIWGISVSGSTEISNSSSITFQLSNGTYDYYVNTPSSYSANHTSGIISVYGSSVVRAVGFFIPSSPFNMVSLVPYILSIASLGLAIFVAMTLFRKR
ncbi:MAG: YncE family protein [Thermoplasmata archaeon]